MKQSLISLFSLTTITVLSFSPTAQAVENIPMYDVKATCEDRIPDKKYAALCIGGDMSMLVEIRNRLPIKPEFITECSKVVNRLPELRHSYSLLAQCLNDKLMANGELPIYNVTQYCSSKLSESKSNLECVGKERLKFDDLRNTLFTSEDLVRCDKAGKTYSYADLGECLSTE